MPEVPLYNLQGEVVGRISLAEAIFGAPLRPDLIHRAVVALLANRRAGTASTRTRGEVSGGGRKPWRQKGTGRARQGSIRAPHWVGGGVAHGPKPRRYIVRLPRKVRRQALFSAWSMKVAEGNLKVVEDVALPEWKTKRAQAALKALFPEEEGKVLLLLAAEEWEAERAFRNLPTVRVLPSPYATVYDLVIHDQVLLTRKALQRLEEEFLGKEEMAA